ncbi:MAG: hypothetical protein QF464_22460, partial [Myxococcota bacterium]|nr:hypothetical protein [Myxococcota bacterium]
FALAFTPMLVRAEATESNLQPALFAFWLGLVGWLGGRGWARHVATVGGLGFALLARPELVLIAPVAWLLLCRPWREGKAAWLPVVSLALLAPWQIAHVAQRTAWEVGAESLEFGAAFFGDHLWAHLAETALIEPRIAPLMTTVLALVGLVRLGTERRMVWTLALGGLLWIAVYAVDLSSASAPRLHVAGLQAWSLLAAAVVARFVVSHPGDTSTRPPRTHRIPLIALAGLWLASAAYTVPWLWAPTNEDTEAALVSRLVHTFKAEPGAPRVAVLQHVDVATAPGHGTHRYFPAYLFPTDRVIPLGQATRHLSPNGDRLLYYQGVNCYAELDRDERGGSGLIPACRAVHEQLSLEPIWVEEIANHGNPRFQELGYYGPEPTLQVG